MASNTPNIGLYKKDPIADKNDTFNINTMLNENWDKIDQSLGIKFYRSFEELGITRGQETIESIVNAMANDSMLLEGVGTGWNTSIYPNANGTLFIKKVSNGRTDIEFTSNITNQRWLKKYYDNGLGSIIITDWEELSILKKPVTVLYATLYLDEANGNDLNDGLTPSTALKTSNGLNNKLPLFLQNDMTVNIIGNFTNTLFITNILNSPLNSNRILTIQGSTLNRANHQIYGIRINGCTSSIKFQHLTIGANVLNATNCLNVSVYNCASSINNASSPAIQSVASNMTVENSSITNTGACLYCSLGMLVSKNNTGSGYTSLAVFKGGIIFKSGTQPSGNESIVDGGAILEETRGNAIPTETVVTAGFASGWSGEIRLGKTQEGIKYIHIVSLFKTTDISTGGDIPYTIPTGYRPIKTVSQNLVGYSSSGPFKSGSSIQVRLQYDGVLVLASTGNITADVRGIVGAMLTFI